VSDVEKLFLHSLSASAWGVYTEIYKKKCNSIIYIPIEDKYE